MGVNIHQVALYGYRLTFDEFQEFFEEDTEGKMDLSTLLPYYPKAKLGDLITVEDGMCGEYAFIGRKLAVSTDRRWDTGDFSDIVEIDAQFTHPSKLNKKLDALDIRYACPKLKVSEPKIYIWTHYS
jgi:hypothetical protein